MRHQKVCSLECRKARRKRRAREQREKDLDRYRQDERERQRAWRAQAGEKSGPGEGAREAPQGEASPRMSRASFGSEASEIVEQLLDYLDMAVNRSRTGLRRQVMEILQGFGRERRQGSGPEARCHGPP